MRIECTRNTTVETTGKEWFAGVDSFPAYEKRFPDQDDHQRFLLPGSPGTGRGIGRTGTVFWVCDPWHQFGSQKRGRKQYLTNLHTDPFLSGSGLGTEYCCSVTHQAIVKGSTPHRSRKTEFPVPGVAFLPEEKIIRSDLNIVNLLTQSISASEIPWP